MLSHRLFSRNKKNVMEANDFSWNPMLNPIELNTRNSLRKERRLKTIIYCRRWIFKHPPWSNHRRTDISQGIKSLHKHYISAPAIYSDFVISQIGRIYVCCLPFIIFKNSQMIYLFVVDLYLFILNNLIQFHLNLTSIRLDLTKKVGELPNGIWGYISIYGNPLGGFLLGTSESF